MSVTVRAMIIAVILFLFAALLYSFSSSTGRISEDELSMRFPTFEAEKFRGEIYDQQGQIQYSMFSQEMRYFKPRNLLNAEGLIGFFYDHDDAQTPFRGWQIMADHGDMVLNQHAQLTGNIHVVPNFASAEIKEISTTNVFYDLQKNTISSPSEITIVGERFINRGSDYIVNLDQKLIEIKDKPHAVYYP